MCSFSIPFSFIQMYVLMTVPLPGYCFRNILFVFFFFFFVFFFFQFQRVPFVKDQHMRVIAMDPSGDGIGIKMLADAKPSLTGVAMAMETTSKLRKRAWRDAEIHLACIVRTLLYDMLSILIK